MKVGSKLQFEMKFPYWATYSSLLPAKISA